MYTLVYFGENWLSRVSLNGINENLRITVYGKIGLNLMLISAQVKQNRMEYKLMVPYLKARKSINLAPPVKILLYRVF